MRDFDVFNGDADGLCSLVQLRLAEPRAAQLVTGVKRDINLLERVPAGEAERVCALDISLDKNREALQGLLDAGASVFYCDHHYAGDIPESDSLEALINPAPEVCTALLINGYLGGRHAEWAVVGAFGDNLGESARAAARPLGLDAGTLDTLEQLGIYLNYNGYGPSLDDLHFDPADLFRELVPFASPLEFIAGNRDVFERLQSGYRADMAAAESAPIIAENDTAAVLLLPDEAWARRVSGVFGNELANRHPGRAHAVLTERADGTYLVSVRAPLQRREGADTLCRDFPTGGGRAAAAGINALPQAELDRFLKTMLGHFAP